MKTIALSPIPETPEDYAAIERELKRLWKEELYQPLAAELGAPKLLSNEVVSPLAQAIASGEINFYRGLFTGRFNSRTSTELRRIGAKRELKQGGWALPLGECPEYVRTAIASSNSRMERVLGKIDEILSRLLPERIAEKFDARKLMDRLLWKVNKRVDSQVKNISVMPNLTDEQRERIASDYTENMRLYIKGWTEEEILKLREKVRLSATAGNRYESLIGYIQKSYGSSRSKAQFLARQETSIFMATFKQARYESAGSKGYIWRCVHGSPAHPVRPMHKMHNGKKFLWSSPPIVDDKGNRKHPGMDYGCRCTAVPLLSVDG